MALESHSARTSQGPRCVAGFLLASHSASPALLPGQRAGDLGWTREGQAGLGARMQVCSHSRLEGRGLQQSAWALPKRVLQTREQKRGEY